MTHGDGARLYHRLSSYTYVPGDGLPPPIPHELVVQDFQSMEPQRLPPLWKTYAAGPPAIDLPRSWRSPVMSGTDALAGRPAPMTAPLDLPGLARVLHLSAGVTRIRPKDARRRAWTFRAAGSAGGLCPFEVYVAVHGIAGVADGVWWYEPQRHALVRIGPAPAGDATTRMTFLDDELEALIAPLYPGRSMGGLLITCVGVPDYPSKPGGMPGNPTSIVPPYGRETPRQVPPRP